VGEALARSFCCSIDAHSRGLTQAAVSCGTDGGIRALFFFRGERAVERGGGYQYSRAGDPPLFPLLSPSLLSFDKRGSFLFLAAEACTKAK
jgi:hypothetical protein